MLTRIKQYPARTQALVVAVIFLLTAFGVPWDEIQVSAVTGVSATGIALFLEGIKPGKP